MFFIFYIRLNNRVWAMDEGFLAPAAEGMGNQRNKLKKVTVDRRRELAREDMQRREAEKLEQAEQERLRELRCVIRALAFVGVI